MKKIFAAIVIILMCFAMSACASAGTDDSQLKHGTKENNKSTTALNVNLISVFSAVNEDNPEKYDSQYFLEIGARTDALSQDEADVIISHIGSQFEIRVSYVKSYFVKDDKMDYCYYVYTFNSAQNFRQAYTKYGFFFIKQNYILNSHYWVNDLRRAVLDKAQSMFEIKQSLSEDEIIRIDEDSSRLRYFFVQETDLKAKGAQKIFKDVVNQKNLASLMWETTSDDYDFSSLELSILAMASGWFVVAIIFGVIVVLIIMFSAKEKINYVEMYRLAQANANNGNVPSTALNSAVGVSQMSFEEIGGDPLLKITEQTQSAADDGGQEPDEGKVPEILDNQISMTEYLGDVSEGENGGQTN